MHGTIISLQRKRKMMSADEHLLLTSPESVLEYWFDFLGPREPHSLEYIERMMGIWFAGKSPEFDIIQKKNENLVIQVGNMAIDHAIWQTPHGILARVLLLDQFSRCIYRGTAQAFQYDNITAKLVKDTFEKGWISKEYTPIERFFMGVAIQHAEDIEMQRIGLKIAAEVAAGAPQEIMDFFANLKGYPHEHHDVIEMFGRFPSRNGALGRQDTDAELQWMQSPDCPAWAKSQLTSSKKDLSTNDTD